MAAPFSIIPQWTAEPTLDSLRDSIRRAVKDTTPSQEVTVVFLTQGASNTIYHVTIGDNELIMRISLPVDRHYKTLSEVTTVEWIRRNTNIPVPLSFL
jgi:hypothetical protein